MLPSEGPWETGDILSSPGKWAVFTYPVNEKRQAAMWTVLAMNRG